MIYVPLQCQQLRLAVSEAGRRSQRCLSHVIAEAMEVATCDSLAALEELTLLLSQLQKQVVSFVLEPLRQAAPLGERPPALTSLHGLALNGRC